MLLNSCLISQFAHHIQHYHKQSIFVTLTNQIILLEYNKGSIIDDQKNVTYTAFKKAIKYIY